MTQFIPFDKLNVTTLSADLDQQLAASRAIINQIEQEQSSSYATIIVPLHEQLYRLNHIWNLIEHLHSVTDTPELRDLYDNYLPSITDLYVNLGQNQALYQHLNRIQAQE